MDSLQQFSGAPLFNFAGKFEGMRKVADLVYYDGPVVALYHTHSGEQFVFDWVDCDRTHNRWLAVPSTNVMVRDYIERRATLRDLILNPSDQFLYCLDVDANGAYTDAIIISPHRLPDNYLPSERSLCPGEPQYIRSDVYTIELDGDWEISGLRQIDYKFQTLYAVVYNSMARANMPAFRGDGWSHVHNFSRMIGALPDEAKPELMSVRYASPGTLQLKGDPDTLAILRSVLSKFRRDQEQIWSTYSFVYRRLHEEGLLKRELSRVPDDSPVQDRALTEMLDQLAGGLGLPNQNFRAITNRLTALRLLLGTYRRVKDLLDMEQEGKAHF